MDATNPVQPPLRKPGLLSPLNRRRLDNFKANRRGLWSLWIFAILFVLTLVAELIANDRPIVVSYKGEILFPIVVAYPEEKFGGFLAVTDYRDPTIRQEIEENGWAIWPPIRYSYRTVRTDGGPFPARPTWMKPDGAACTATTIAERVRLPLDCEIGNWNWLGTDDQGRDVVARLIYGFRISVLFV